MLLVSWRIYPDKGALVRRIRFQLVDRGMVGVKFNVVGSLDACCMLRRRRLDVVQSTRPCFRPWARTRGITQLNDW